MNMVIVSTNLNRKTSLMLRDARHVAEDVFSISIRQPSLTIFCAEDDVIKQLLMSAHD
jgi:hypothetical protein